MWKKERIMSSIERGGKGKVSKGKRQNNPKFDHLGARRKGNREGILLWHVRTKPHERKTK